MCFLNRVMLDDYGARIYQRMRADDEWEGEGRSNHVIHRVCPRVRGNSGHARRGAFAPHHDDRAMTLADNCIAWITTEPSAKRDNQMHRVVVAEC